MRSVSACKLQGTKPGSDRAEGTMATTRSSQGLELRDLFGGMMRMRVPRHATDISDFRPVPDHQVRPAVADFEARHPRGTPLHLAIERSLPSSTAVPLPLSLSAACIEWFTETLAPTCFLRVRACVPACGATHTRVQSTWILVGRL